MVIVLTTCMEKYCGLCGTRLKKADFRLGPSEVCSLCMLKWAASPPTVVRLPPPTTPKPVLQSLQGPVLKWEGSPITDWRVPVWR